MNRKYNAKGKFGNEMRILKCQLDRTVYGKAHDIVFVITDGRTLLSYCNSCMFINITAFINCIIENRRRATRQLCYLLPFCTRLPASLDVWSSSANRFVESQSLLGNWNDFLRLHLDTKVKIYGKLYLTTWLKAVIHDALIIHIIQELRFPPTCQRHLNFGKNWRH